MVVFSIEILSLVWYILKLFVLIAIPYLNDTIIGIFNFLNYQDKTIYNVNKNQLEILTVVLSKDILSWFSASVLFFSLSIIKILSQLKTMFSTLREFFLDITSIGKKSVRFCIVLWLFKHIIHKSRTQVAFCTRGTS